MKTLKRLFIITVLLGLVFLNTTCSKLSAPKYITWEGHIYDSIGRPIKGLGVSLDGCNSVSGESHPQVCYEEYRIGSTKTDSLGHFYINGKASSSGDYRPSVDMPYAPYWDPMENVGGAELITSHYTNIHLQR